MTTTNDAPKPAPNPFSASGLFQSADVWTPMKVAIDGGPGDGKTFAMTEIGRGIWAAEGRKCEVVLMDTERSAKTVIPYFRECGLIEGQNFFISHSRSLLDFQKILKLCIERKSILLIDSVTHFHEAFISAFEDEKKRKVIYPQDALVLKPEWKKGFSKPLVDAECHIIFTGRAAWEYRMEINPDTKKKEFNPTKLKMRGDPELLYEPSYVLFAEQDQRFDGDGNLRAFHLLTVLKDRSRLQQGQIFEFDPRGEWKASENPIWDKVKPVYEFYARGRNPDAPHPAETPMGQLFAKGNADAWFAARRQAEQTVEEIEGTFNQWIPGSGGLEKQLRSVIYAGVFKKRSKLAIAEMDPRQLSEGLDAIDYIARYCAKNYDFLEKLSDSGKYEELNDFVNAEIKKFEEAVAKTVAPELDAPPVEFVEFVEEPAEGELADQLRESLQEAQKKNEPPATAEPALFKETPRGSRLAKGLAAKAASKNP
jgi:hypothetical protein